MKEKRAPILGIAVMVTAALTLLLFVSTSVASPSTDSTSTLASPIPGQITYQGQLLDPNTGSPMPDGQYDMVFTIYDQDTLGNALWTQSFTGASGVQVTGGQFTVYLGSGANPIRPDVFTGAMRWLGVQVGADPEMTPRTLLTSVPYAIRAETLRAGGITSDTLPSPLYKFHNTAPGGHALVAEGDVHVQGNLTWAPRTGRTSVSPSAFQPWQDTYSYQRTGRGMHTTSGQHYYAPVYLPEGSTVTKMTFYYRDDATTTGAVTMTLKRGNVGNTSSDDMAQVGSADGGYGSGYDDTISYAQVNNDGNIYWLYAYFDGSLDDYRRVMAVVIEYEISRPY